MISETEKSGEVDRDAEQRRDVERRVWTRDGSEAVYSERRWIAHVRVTVLRFDDELELRVEVIRTAGFVPPERTTWTAGVARQHFRSGDTWWLGSPYAGWAIAFDPEDVAALVTAAGEVSNLPSDERSNRLRRRFGELMMGPSPSD